MKMIKTVVERAIKGIGRHRINRFLNHFDIKFEIAKRGANYYNYYWGKAFKKVDLKTIPEFGELAAQIIAEKRTFLDYDRLYTFWQAIRSLNATDGPLAEIGSYKGGSAKFILEALQMAKLPNKLYVFDTFEGHAVVDEHVDGPHAVGQFNETSFEEVSAYLNSSAVDIYKGDFLKTAKHIADVSNFGIVHIDVDVYPVTKFCLDFFEKRTIPGSILIIDDYGNNYCKGLRKAVDEFSSSHSEFKIFYLLTGQALMLKIS